MSVSKLFIRPSLDIAHKEIKGITQTVFGDRHERIETNANDIARRYLEINKLVNPITLARSSFYIALKKESSNPNSKIQLIKHNNGRENKWWIHLVPIIEQQIKNV